MMLAKADVPGLTIVVLGSCIANHSDMVATCVVVAFENRLLPKRKTRRQMQSDYKVFYSTP